MFDKAKIIVYLSIIGVITLFFAESEIKSGPLSLSCYFSEHEIIEKNEIRLPSAVSVGFAFFAVFVFPKKYISQSLSEWN